MRWAVDIVGNPQCRRFHGVGTATDIVESSAKRGSRPEQYLARR